MGSGYEEAVEKIDQVIETLRKTESAISTLKPSLIAGEWLSEGKTVDVKTFYNEKIAQLPLSNEKMLEKCIEHAHEFLKAISLKPENRIEIINSCRYVLEKNKESISRLHAKQTGQAVSFCISEIEKSLKLFNELKDISFKHDSDGKTVTRVSSGVFVATLNDSISNMCTLLSLSLLTGTPVVLFPNRSPLTVIEILKIFTQAGFPKDLVSVLIGFKKDYLHKIKNATFLNFNVKEKYLVMVCGDASIEKTAKDISSLVTSTYPVVVFAETDIFEALSWVLREKIKSLKGGDPLSEKTQLWSFDENTLRSFRLGVLRASKKPSLAYQAGLNFIPGLFLNGEFDAELAKINFPAVVMFRNRDLNSILHYAPHVKAQRASIYTHKEEKAEKAVSSLDIQNISLNSPALRNYENLLRALTKLKVVRTQKQETQ